MLLKNNLQGVSCYVSNVNYKRYENVQALTIISKTKFVTTAIFQLGRQLYILMEIE